MSFTGITPADKPLANKTLFITGASRGIGKAIALRAARDGANIVIAAKTAQAHAKLPGTIYSAATEIEAAGGKALPVATDIRDETQIEAAVAACVATFGGIDMLVNNASAISLTGTAETPLARFDLMHRINARGTFACTQACLPHLRASTAAQVLMIAPPLNMAPHWFAPHLAYTMAKYGMSMCVLGMAEEFRGDGIAVNALWPRTVIATAALNLLPAFDVTACRDPAIVADAAYLILSGAVGDAGAPASGRFFIDEEVLAAAGITDFDRYAVDPATPPQGDLFVD